MANCDNPDPTMHQHYEQPVIQTLNMFVGECLCLILYPILFYSARRGQAYERVEGDGASRRDVDAAFDGDSSDRRAKTSDENVAQIIPSALKDEELVIEADMLAADQVVEQSETLVGYRSLLLWFPVLCDICGTTVCSEAYFDWAH